MARPSFSIIVSELFTAVKASELRKDTRVGGEVAARRHKVNLIKNITRIDVEIKNISSTLSIHSEKD